MPFHKFSFCNFVICALLMLSIWGCSKNDTNEPVTPEKPTTVGGQDKVTFPRTLYLTDVSVKAVAKVYVGQTEITNKAVIDKYISPSAPYYSDLFFLENKNLPADSKTPGLIFGHADTVYYSGTTERFKVTKTNNNFYFKSVVSLIIPLPIIPYPEILKYSETIKTAEYSGVLNTIMVGAGNYDEIKLSGISYKLYQHIELPGITPGRVGYNLSFHNNEFNTDVVKTLGAKDTLAIKEYVLTYKVR